MKPLKTSILVFCALAATSYGVIPNDPIIGTWTGEALTLNTLISNGSEPDYLFVSAPFALDFGPTGTAILDETLPGEWRKKQGRYSVELSDAYLDTIIVAFPDSDCTAKFVLKKIQRFGDHFQGNVKIKFTVNDEQQSVFAKQAGFVVCARDA